MSTDFVVDQVVYLKHLLNVVVLLALLCDCFFLLCFPFTLLCLLVISHAGLSVAFPVFYLSFSMDPHAVHLHKIVLVFSCYMLLLSSLMLQPPAYLRNSAMLRLLVMLHLLSPVCVLVTVASPRNILSC